MQHRHGILDFAGSIHFITLATRVPGNWFITSAQCRAMLDVFEGYRAKADLDCFGYVLMPDYLHALLRQTDSGPFVSMAVQGFKSVTSRTCRPLSYPTGPLWLRRYDDVPIPGRDAALTRMDYMHDNPLRRRLVRRREEYVWSSLQYYLGKYPQIVTLTDL
jgi:hypothetical protein